MHDDAFLVFSLPNMGILRDTIILFCLLYILINVAQYSSLKSGWRIAKFIPRHCE